VQETQPDEIYNLAAQSHVQVSFETAEYTANADGVGVLRLLEAIRILKMEEKSASTRQRPLNCMARCRKPPQKKPRPLSAQPLCRRQALCLLDHGELSRSLWHACFQRHPVQSRRADARRNVRHPQGHPRRRRHSSRLSEMLIWETSIPSGTGVMPATSEGMHLILQQDRPDDYVLATGETHSVREFIELAFAETAAKSSGVIRVWTNRAWTIKLAMCW